MNLPEMSGRFILRSSRQVYANPWIEVREDAITRPGGSDGVFGVVTMRTGSSVVAIDEDDRILLAVEFKYGVGRETLELISGALDQGETALEAARRELEEEAGIVASSWVDLGVIDPFTTVVHSPNHLFLAQDLTTTEIDLDDGEIVAIRRVPFDDAVEMVLQSRITHGASCVAILKAARQLGR